MEFALLSLWWLLFLSAVGLVVGSFLNVVIYRVPRDQGLTEPTWSACPHCGHRIRFHDNIPVLSFLLLRGRCRDCGGGIATRYVIVELLMALVVLLLVDAMFVSQLWPGGEDRRFAFGLTMQLADSWPMLLAHIVLFACLIAMSAIDLEHYWVDIRFTSFAVVMGFVLHAIWNPADPQPWIQPGPTLGLMGLAAVVGAILSYVLWMLLGGSGEDHRTEGNASHDDASWLQPVDATLLPCEAGEPLSEDAILIDSGEIGVSELDDSLPAAALPGGTESIGDVEPAGEIWEEAAHPAYRRGWGGVVLGWLLGLTFVGLLASLWLVDGFEKTISWQPRVFVPLGVLFLIIVGESCQSRESDVEIIEAIEEERFNARRMVMVEWAWLLPSMLLAGLAWYLCQYHDGFADRWQMLLHWQPVRDVTWLRGWTPVLGIATASTGLFVGAAVGWGIRIFFTLLFGKEAFGAGDIHLLAAAGCIAGWPVAALGFILSAVLALAGWVATLPVKQGRAIPLGPWLSIAFLLIVVCFSPLMASQPVQGVIRAVGLLLGN